MSDVNFRLKRPDARRATSIIVSVSHTGQRYRKSTGISVSPDVWNARTQRLRLNAPQAVVMNKRLDEIATAIARFKSDAQLSGRNLNSADIDRALRIPHIPETTTTSSIPDEAVLAIDSWIEAHRGERKKTTLQVWRALENHLRRLDAVSGSPLLVQNMNVAWFDDLVAYLREDRNLCDSAIWRHIRVCRSFCNWAESQGATTGGGHRTVSAKRFRTHPSHAVRLTASHLDQLKRIELADRPGLDNARNLFLLQCSTGVRYSDLIRLVADPDDFVDDDCIRLRTRKTDTEVRIPLLPMTRVLLSMQPGIRVISNQKYNSYMKEIGALAGLTNPVIRVKWYGSERKEVRVRMCDLLSSHAAKRTFVTLLATAGVRTETIMKITGNTRSTIDSYVHLNEAEVEAEVLGKAAELF